MVEQKNDIEQVEATTPKTEEQIRAELQVEYEKIADKRVTDALKKQEKKWAEKLNKEKRTQEQEDITKQAEQTKADEAKERMATSTGGATPQPKENLPQPVKKVRDQLGEIAGVSGKTIDRVETILTKGTTKDIQEVREGKSSISGKAKEIKERTVQPVVKRPQAEKKEFLRGTTPRVGNGKPISVYDIYKRDGNVNGMLSEKLSAYQEADDY